MRNSAAPERPVSSDSGAISIWTDAYPARSETFIYNEVAAIRSLGWSVRVVSMARPARIERGAARRDAVAYLEDVPPATGAWCAISMVTRHPIRALRDVRSRSRWAAEEETWPLRSIASEARRPEGELLHVHFAAGAALNAMRLSRITGRGYSVIGHGFDVFAEPRNLAEKIRCATVAIAPCEYTAKHMRDIADRDVGVIVMGVDTSRFARAQPTTEQRSVIAVGRLVEKKGFADLIRATGALEAKAPLDRVTIVGSGPLHGQLRELAISAGVEQKVHLIDAWGSAQVAGALGSAALLVAPSVIARDGDRDAMPVVVKEALSMELPVVSTDVCGLPEIVWPEWGETVRPGDPEALATAIQRVLALPASTRRQMGATGRRHVIEYCSIEAQARGLLHLIDTPAR